MLAFLDNIRLTLTQWALLLTATLCGALVVALKLQGSKLHKAQVNALSEHLRSETSLEDAKLRPLRDRFIKALTEYRKASE